MPTPSVLTQREASSVAAGKVLKEMAEHVEVCFTYSSILTDVLVYGRDVNECARNLDDCSDFAQCTNTIGTYACTCIPGYSGDGKTCTG